MNLWATGHNAWNQLQFNGTLDDEPDDLYTFTNILEGTEIDRPVARLSYTIVRRDQELLAAGSLPHIPHGSVATATIQKRLQDIWPRIEASNGACIDEQGLLSPPPSACQVQQPVEVPSTIQTKLKSLMENTKLVKHAASYETGFVVLVTEQDVSRSPNLEELEPGVYTVGDARHAPCLGRHVDESEQPWSFGRVTDLHDLPGGRVVRVVAGGYMLGAITESGDLYCWGGGPAGPQPLPGLTDLPEAIEPPDGKDIEDAAIGEAHMIVLCQDGTVYTRGDNRNGQLGAGPDTTGADSPNEAGWFKVNLDLELQQKVVAVEAGPRASFIILSTL